MLIAGGDGKGGDFSDLAASVEGKLRGAVLIGQDADKMARALDTVMPVHFAENMEAAVHVAASCAESAMDRSSTRNGKRLPIRRSASRSPRRSRSISSRSSVTPTDPRNIVHE